MAGRRPKPLAMHQLNGNPRHFSQADLTGSDNPQPALVEPEMPKGMPKAARREWKRIVPLLRDVGVLSVIDGLALAGYCRNVAIIEAMQKDIDENGYTFRTMYMNKEGDLVPGDIKANPAVGIMFKAESLMKAFLIEFGLTPASRSKLKIAKKDEGDAMAKFLNRKPSAPVVFAPPRVDPKDMLAEDEPKPEEPATE